MTHPKGALDTFLDGLGVRLVPTKRRRRGAQSHARASVREMIRDHGEKHASLVLRFIIDSEGNKGALWSETIGALSDVMLQRPDWPERASDVFSALDFLERERCSAEKSEAVEWAAEMLTSNFKARRKFRTEEDQRADDGRVFDGFLIALDGRPAAAVTEAVRRIIAKETDLSPTFVPTATEVAGIVKAITDRWTFERGRLERLAMTVEEAPAEPERELTPEERQRLNARVAQITGKAASRR